MLGTVYIETTIPSYYHETRETPTTVAWRTATRSWWDFHRSRYEVYTSEYVLTELELAPPDKARQTMAMVRELSMLEEPAGLQDVISFYIDHHLMPAGAQGDAAHLALASMHGMAFLLTWNCQHLANANKIRHLQVLNARLGLPVPVLTTPLTLLAENEP